MSDDYSLIRLVILSRSPIPLRVKPLSRTILEVVLRDKYTPRFVTMPFVSSCACGPGVLPKNNSKYTNHQPLDPFKEILAIPTQWVSHRYESGRHEFDRTGPFYVGTTV